MHSEGLFKQIYAQAVLAACLTFGYLAPSAAQMACHQAHRDQALFVVKEMDLEKYRDDVAEEVVYYTLQERELFKVSVNSKGQLIDSTGEALTTPKGTLWIYVMDKRGQIYILQEKFQRRGLQNHSSVLAGDHVAAAGDVVLKEGRIQFINNGSGHYVPEAPFFKQLIRQLQALNADLSEMKIRVLGEKSWVKKEDLADFSPEQLDQVKIHNLLTQLSLPWHRSSENLARFIRKAVEMQNPAFTRKLAFTLAERSADPVLLQTLLKANLNHDNLSALIRGLIDVISGQVPDSIRTEWIPYWLTSRSSEIQKIALTLHASKFPKHGPELIEMLLQRPALLASSEHMQDLLSRLLMLHPLPEIQQRQVWLQILGLVETSLRSSEDPAFGAQVEIIRQMLYIAERTPMPREGLERLRLVLVFIRDRSVSGKMRTETPFYLLNRLVNP